MSKIKLFFALYLLVIVALFLYSYTQVDLSLTLSRSSLFQTVEKAFQYIGYFQRPLSTYLYISLVVLLSLFYLCLLRLVNLKKITKRQLWIFIIVTTGVLIFAYNAFSYDLFNYIFDAKIITHYHQNPFVHKALDFPGDPMLSFMHWTHRTYPYGPTWLLMTVPLSFIGLGFFLLTFFLFKILMGLCFLGILYYIGKILKKTSPKDELLGIAFFALNPLVIIESLISAHNDSAMMFFVIMAFYFLIQKRYIISLGALFLSIGVKFATGILFPIFILPFVNKKLKKPLSWDTIFFISFLLMGAAVIAASKRTTFQVWYLLYLLPFAAVLPQKKYIVMPSIILSIGNLFVYVPYLFLGNYNPPVPDQLFTITACSVGLALLSVCAYGLALKFKRV